MKIRGKGQVMASYQLINGFIIPAEVADRANELQRLDGDSYPEGQRTGRPRLSGEPNSNLSFKCPESNARMIAYAAKISGTGKSAFMRDAAVEKAARVISMHRAKEPSED